MLTDDYALGLDGGSSRLIAAVATPSPEEGVVVAPCRLGADRIDIPTAAYVTEDGDVLFGEAAEKQGSEHPERLLHDFVRDVGDSTPLIAGGFAVRADDLYARLMGWAVTTVTAAQGAPPARIAIAHPDWWRGHRIEAVRTRLSEMGLDDVLLLPAAASAARQQYAAGGLPARGAVAVYDFGGSGFCGTVLRAQGGGDYRLTGTPIVLDDVSGRAFDHRVLRHALAMAERRMTPAGPPAGSPGRNVVLPAAALSAARHAATTAKEALSFGPEATIELEFDDRRSSVRLTRYEFESVIGADLSRTADALDRALEVAGVDADQVDAIVLAGGSSRIPAVVEHLSARFDLPLCASDPHVAAVFGAARAAWSVHEAHQSTTREPGAEEGAIPAPTPRPRRTRRPVRLRPAISGAVMLSVGTLLIAGAAFATVLPDGRQDEAVGETFPGSTPAGKGLALPLAWTPGIAAVDGPAAGPGPQPVTQLGPVLPVDDGEPRTRSDAPSSPGRSSPPPAGTNAGSPAEADADQTSDSTTAPATGGAATTPTPSGGTAPTPTPTPEPTPPPDPAPSGEPQTPSEPSPDPPPAPDPSPSPSADPVPLVTSEPAPSATP